jgi:transcription elongation GreA/GreB family factor
MNLNLSVKQKAKAACLEKLKIRMQVCHKQLNQIQEDLANETKSSAGDKYETGRAMLQIEREKLGNQLAKLEKLEQVLFSISTEQEHAKIQLGSLVQTSQFNYFISVSLGEISVDEISFYAISKQTPIAEQLLGKEIGKQVNFRNQTFEITGVV